jgi:hypothetical protein
MIYNSLRVGIKRGTNQIYDARGCCLILSTLGKEQEPLAGLVCPSSIRMCDFGLLCTKIAVQSVGLEGFVAEPEETL